MLNSLFLLSRLKSLNYAEYILFKKKNKQSYEIVGEYSTVAIIIVMIYLRLWNTQLTPFFLPWEYLMLISLLLFQKQAIFVLKLVVFPPVWVI